MKEEIETAAAVITVADAANKVRKKAIAYVTRGVVGDNDPEFEKAIVEGRSEALRELAKSDEQSNAVLYRKLEENRKRRGFNNFSNVLMKFAGHVTDQPSSPPKDDNDFFWNMWEHAKSVSDEHIQDLIAKILADEYQQPNTHSISTLKRLEYCDRETIEKIGTLNRIVLNGYVITNQQSFLGGGLFTHSEKYMPVLKDIDFYFKDFLELQTLGFIHVESSSGKTTVKKGETRTLSYMGKHLIFKAVDDVDAAFPSGLKVGKDFEKISRFLDVKESSIAQDYIIQSVESAVKNLKYEKEELCSSA